MLPQHKNFTPLQSTGTEREQNKLLRATMSNEKVNPEQVIAEFESLTKDAKRVQVETLRKILEENSSSEYLEKWGLKGKFNPETYISRVPLVTHPDLEPYIQRIADGETNVLTKKPFSVVSLSSGTTQGKSKFIPYNDDLTETTMQIFLTSFAFRNREFPISEGKSLQFIYGSKQFKTKGGLIAGTATTNVYRSENFRETMKAMNSPCCSPQEVIFGPDFQQSLYCHLLCGLIYRDEIQYVASSFAHSIVNSLRTFELVWEELCSDIRTGVLSSRVTAQSLRTAMEKILKPDPLLADFIYEKCLSLNNWYGLIPEIFPSAKYVYGIMTGSMLPYMKKLQHYAGELPLICADYGASEGWVAVNVNPSLPPEKATFAVPPNIGYFEFIPLKEITNGPGQESAKPKTVGLTEVNIGEEYEVVLTNSWGMYRYRLGDVVKVVGFYNSTPELQFIRRGNVVLMVNIDKCTEEDLQLSVETAAKVLAEENLELIDFTSHVNMSIEPGHYVIYWEISGDASTEVLQQCCDCLDRSFVDAGYVSSRKINAIGPLELRVLAKGTFGKIVAHYVGTMGLAPNQLKMPRCISPANKIVLEILAENVVKSFLSTAFN